MNKILKKKSAIFLKSIENTTTMSYPPEAKRGGKEDNITLDIWKITGNTQGLK